jgi:hypothetical protein
MNSLTKQGRHYKYNGPEYYKYNGTEFNKDLSSNDKLECIEITCNTFNFNIHSGLPYDKHPYAKFPLCSLNLKELILIGSTTTGPFPNLSSLKNLEKLEIINPSGRAPDINILGCINLLYFTHLSYSDGAICATGCQVVSDNIDVSHCLKLEYYHTRCMNTDLTKCKKLKYVDCIWNSKINCLSSCNNLVTLILHGYYPSIECLNLSRCYILKYIEVNNVFGNSSFQMPNISKCQTLKYLKCHGNAILPDLTECINLNHFEYKGCYPLPDLSKCSKLEYFDYKGDYSLPNLSHCTNIKIIYNGIHQEDMSLKIKQEQIKLDIEKLKKEILHIQKNKFEEETKHKFEQLELFHIEESFNRNDILSKIEERFNKLEEENRRLHKIIDQLQPTQSKFM